MSNSYPNISFVSPVLCAVGGHFVFLNKDGEIKPINNNDAYMLTGANPLLVCHAAYTAQKINIQNNVILDVLELYAFVFPTKFCVPTVHGVAVALGLNPPVDNDDYPLILIKSVETLLFHLSNHPNKEKLLDIAAVMGHNGRAWGWTTYVFTAMGKVYDPKATISSSRNKLNVWKNLPEWTESAPQPPPANHPITGDEVREALHSILTTKKQSEQRAEQVNYATRIAEGFRAPDTPEQPHIILAEAGTGVGKTLGYLAPATVWSSKNEGAVLVSTYTKNLQRQISEEFKRIYPDPELRARKVTIRKGRENYLCLLNFEDLAAAATTSIHKQTPIAAGLMTRWVMETEDGDLTGTSFHGWLPSLVGRNTTLGLSDRRGECIFSGCEHFHRCFGENAIRKASRTPLIIANHAVVMIKAAHHDDDLPHHIIFDEGHHVFDAADASFCAELTGNETYDLRRWLLGVEGGRKSRARGIKKRIEDLISDDAQSIKFMEDIIHRARFLPMHDWLPRLKQGNVMGSTEEVLRDVYQQVWARADDKQSPYSLETNIFPISDPLQISIKKLLVDMKELRQPIARLAARLKQKLVEETETLSPETRTRLDAVAASLERRINTSLTPWVSLLQNIIDGEVNTEMIDWLEINRNENNIFDVGMHRHYIDPTKPLMQSLKTTVHSITITSATLKDRDGEDWTSADIFSGTNHIDNPPIRFSVASPYDYINQTRVFIVTDVKRGDIDQLSAAYRALFIAAGGGALGLFTSIQRLMGVHKRITKPLSDNNITLYAQHVDGIDTGTLVDMFRDDIHSCLLGTDAVRDGVDVPGESLRLIAFDRVPWPRATLLHKARKNEFGGAGYEDRLTRLKLKQAFGRLIRTSTDRGIFVMLDSAMPSRLTDAFPEGVIIERLGIAEVVQKCKEFYVM